MEEVDFAKLDEVRGITLVITPQSKYDDLNLELVRRFIKQGYSIIYISVNRPCKLMSEKFEGRGIACEKFFFVDCASFLSNEMLDRKKNVLLVNSPSDLTSISIALTKLVERTRGRKRLLFLDSVSALMIYNSANSVEKFVHFLSGRMRLLGMDGVIISLDEKDDEHMIEVISEFCDKVIRL
ncbi:MAG: hypothetical protein V1494_04830 [Candidatus Diapherotrites archaeon]